MDEDCLDDDANDSCSTDDRTVAVSNVNPEIVVLKNRNKPVSKLTVKTPFTIESGKIKYSYYTE